MKNLILTICLFLSTPSFAGTKGFEIQINEVSVNGGVDAQPRKHKVKPDQMVVISSSFDASGTKTFVEMKVSDDKDGILVKLAVIEEKNGVKKTVATPQLLVNSGQKAEMALGKEGEAEFLKVSLVGTRIQ